MTSQPVSTANPHLGWGASATAAAAGEAWPAAAPDPARRLQLALAFLWLLDAVLQFQAFMFGRGFAAMLQAAATGNPAVIADPINWSAHLIEQHAVLANAAFATIQLVIGLGIACRPTVRIALGLSIGWSLAVWWLGEGLGGLVTGTASPVSGAPGAVLIYALIAVLLWPSPSWRASPAPFAAARRTGAAVARLLWLVLWGGLAVLAVLPATRAPGAISGLLDAAASGQPAWLAGADQHVARFLSHGGGPVAAVMLATTLAVIAAGIYLPRSAVRFVLLLAMAVAAASWLAEGLGGLMTGAGTDPDSGPLLALLALAYWPRADSGSRGIRAPRGTASLASGG